MAVEVRTKRVAAWYHGGVASACAAMCTHPLDLLKVHLQTQQQGNLGLVGELSIIVFHFVGSAHIDE